jgi:stringent starvation protein B
MPERSTKPYLIRALHEWCTDSGLTPYLAVKVDERSRVPVEYVKDGQIVLNLSYDATHKLTIGMDTVQFAARFGGVSRECSVPISAVIGIFAKENGQGMFFEAEPAEVAGATATIPAAAENAADTPSPEPTPPTRPRLQVVK